MDSNNQLDIGSNRDGSIERAEYAGNSCVVTVNRDDELLFWFLRSVSQPRAQRFLCTSVPNLGQMEHYQVALHP